MAVACPSCGTDNPDGAKFCAECAAPLAPLARPRESRRTVTILFADVSGSTSLGEQLDPESLRALMGRYFAEMQTIIERHGGTVEKFIGDAVMAVFGIPRVHEDDALRAVRASAEIRERLSRLNIELDAERGVAISFRTGVNTGQVVAGDPASGPTLVTGDAVNTAARLEQAAAPGEILIGPVTYQLVRDAVSVEPLAPLELKGKSQPVHAYRLVSVVAGASGRARRPDAPLVGREPELARLRQGFAAALAERRCMLLTLVAPAGVGKSRLVAEFLASLSRRATVLAGRCLPYGEGITYWPVAEVIRMAAAISEADDRVGAIAKLRRLVDEAPDTEIVAERIGQAIGLEGGSAPQEEIFWALRKLLETLARQRPLVVEFDDIQWADDTFLDLLEHIVQLANDAPLLIVCAARPELFERRPGWGSGLAQAAVLRLEPLAAETAGRLIDQLPGGRELPDPLRARILEAAEGNPLFVEEMMGMLIDDGHLTMTDGRWLATIELAEVTVPPTISALLAARLDQLQPSERSLAERASVVGQSFEQASLAELLPAGERGAMARDLLALVRKELIRPERSVLSAGDAYRFRHMLIRDAAYESLPKANRAELHERFGSWLEQATRDRLDEYEEIIGYHLEEAYRYRAELGMHEAEPSLADRAARRLGSAGRRAYSRGDMRTTVNLLGRAAALWPAGAARRLEVLPDLADALAEMGEESRGLRLLDEGLDLAARLGDARLRAHLLLARRGLSSERPWSDLAERDAEQAREVFESAGDDVGIAAAWRMLGFAAWERLDSTAAVAAWERAAEHARRSGDAAGEAHDRAWLSIALFFGPGPVEEGLKRVQETLELVKDVPAARAEVLWQIASFHAMLGQFEDARQALATSRAIERDLGRDATANHFGTQVAELNERLEGRTAERVRVLREGIDAFEHATGQMNPLLNASLAHALVEVGQDEEAERVAQAVRASPGGENPWVKPTLLAAMALVRARKGAADEAETLSHEAVTMMRATEFSWLLGDALMVHSEVLNLSGKRADAIAAVREAVRLYEGKGIRPFMARARALLATLETP
ncbi:MAG: adenylate/guanylate cyclase domain-containing protein [Chloroflexota bacterium]